MNNLYNSTDRVVRFIEDITNGRITLSKVILINGIRIILKFEFSN